MVYIESQPSLPTHHAALHVEELLRAASGGPEEARGVTLVYEDESLVLVSQSLYVRQRTDIAVHGEDSVRHNQTTSAVLTLHQHSLQVIHVLMFVAILLGLAETDAVDDGGVIEFI